MSITWTTRDLRITCTHSHARSNATHLREDLPISWHSLGKSTDCKYEGFLSKILHIWIWHFRDILYVIITLIMCWQRCEFCNYAQILRCKEIFNQAQYQKILLITSSRYFFSLNTLHMPHVSAKAVSLWSIAKPQNFFIDKFHIVDDVYYKLESSFMIRNSLKSAFSGKVESIFKNRNHWEDKIQSD